MIMAIKRDPIEDTKEYLNAMEKVEPILNKEFPEDGWYMGMCHAYWFRKKELLKQKGIHWHSPKEMNPDIHFD